jgi:hypothetical protein
MTTMDARSAFILGQRFDKDVQKNEDAKPSLQNWCLWDFDLTFVCSYLSSTDPYHTFFPGNRYDDGEATKEFV